MALKIEWSKEAEETYYSIVSYLEEKWSRKEVFNFVERVQSLIATISQHPHIFKGSKSKNIRKAFVTKHSSLFYRITHTHVYLVAFWDNRQDLAKNKFQ